MEIGIRKEKLQVIAPLEGTPAQRAGLRAGDKIIEIENDDDGNPTRPFVNTEMYDISIAEPLRDQNGRIEYWRCAVKLETV